MLFSKPFVFAIHYAYNRCPLQSLVVEISVACTLHYLSKASSDMYHVRLEGHAAAFI